MLYSHCWYHRVTFYLETRHIFVECDTGTQPSFAPHGDAGRRPIASKEVGAGWQPTTDPLVGVAALHFRPRLSPVTSGCERSLVSSEDTRGVVRGTINCLLDYEAQERDPRSTKARSASGWRMRWLSSPCLTYRWIGARSRVIIGTIPCSPLLRLV